MQMATRVTPAFCSIAVLAVLGLALSAKADDFSVLVYTAPDGKTLPYRLLKPKDYDPAKKYPLVIFFHGAGERGNDNQRQLAHCVTVFAEAKNMEQFPCFVIAPQCPENQQWVNVPWGDDSEVQPKDPSDSMQLAGHPRFGAEGLQHRSESALCDGPVDGRICDVGPDHALSRSIRGGRAHLRRGDEKQAGKIASLPIWAFQAAPTRPSKPFAPAT